jgi:hypothetical protein
LIAGAIDMSAVLPGVLCFRSIFNLPAASIKGLGCLSTAQARRHVVGLRGKDRAEPHAARIRGRRTHGPHDVLAVAAGHEQAYSVLFHNSSIIASHSSA